MKKSEVSIREYLNGKNIPFREADGELVVSCLFSGCDEDSRENEDHLYFNTETGQYKCHKCQADGNLVTLKKHFGDLSVATLKKPRADAVMTKMEKYHCNLPPQIQEYFKNERGISDEIIDSQKLGYGEFQGKKWIVIPVFDVNRDVTAIRLRRDPLDDSEPKYRFSTKGSKTSLYGVEQLADCKDAVVICESELDSLTLRTNGFTAVSSTGGAGTFKPEWLEDFEHIPDVALAFDCDKAGESGYEKAFKLFQERFPEKRLYKITFPERMLTAIDKKANKDVTDYFVKHNGTKNEFLGSMCQQVAGRKKIDVSQFKPMLVSDISQALEQTIAMDNANTQITFLSMLSASTDEASFNVSFNGPSSNGKTHIVNEVAKLFSRESIIRIDHSSPKAFFHQQGKYNKENNTHTVDLSRKIIIFSDQSNTTVIENLRPVLSHDNKQMRITITDKTSGGMKVKTVLLAGLPSFIFCSASLKMDEQEATRFFLLSPESSQEKLRQSIAMRIQKETDSENFLQGVEANCERKSLKERVEAIWDEDIRDVLIPNRKLIEASFLGKAQILQSRHSRDVGRFISIIKSVALLNCWFRERQGDYIVASDKDIEEAKNLWEQISENQDYGLPPYVYKIYKDIILPAWMEKESAGAIAELTMQEISQKYYAVYQQPISMYKIRQDILPMLEDASLIYRKKDAQDKRKILIIRPIEKKDESEK